MKKIDIKEFREKGYLQEVNRRFFHPLGLALEIIQENGEERLGGILDYRNDEEGIYYDIKNSDSERKERFEKNRYFIDTEFDNRRPLRVKKLGFFVEPL